MLSHYIPSLLQGDFRTLSRCISAVENKAAGSEALLEQLPGCRHTHIVGITGPPGAGKSTVTDSLIGLLTEKQQKIAVLAIDPSSPFHRGALLGDRIRMRTHFNDPRIFIRSLATRGSLGGLHPEIIGISSLICAAGFDYLIIETVGVGQSEIEVASLAHTTVVVLVPESGDDIQTMKAGLMEVADIFLVNKSDHIAADGLLRNLTQMIHARGKPASGWKTPVIKTIATEQTGISELVSAIEAHRISETNEEGFTSGLLALKAFQLIQSYRMQDINLAGLEADIKEEMKKKDFNLYRFARTYY